MGITKKHEFRLDLIDLNCELLIYTANEFEYCYEKFIEGNTFIKELKNKINNLEDITNEMREKENRFKQNLNLIGEEKEKLEKYELYEFNAIIPGRSKVRIELWDWN